jgi:hydroxyacylglutathione hydrolase
VDRAWQWVVDGPSVRVGMTTSRRDLTTSTVVIARHRALLIDPAWDPDELAGIAADLRRLGVTVAAGFATHAHHDHVLWHPGLGAVPRFASATVAQVCARDRDGIVRRLGPDWPADLGDLAGRVQPVPERLPWADPDVRFITHGAHAPGHTALWLPCPGVLVAGDMLSDVELPLLEESTVAQYADGLAQLRPLVDRVAVLIPGHGHVAVGPGAVRTRWRADRAYLDALLAGHDPDDPRLAHAGMAQAHEQNRIVGGR